MNKNTVYILQKDLPHVKAGTEFSQENNNPDYYNANFCHYHDRLHKSRIINNPTWFKPKEEVNESKPTEQFQWTPDLEWEFARYCKTILNKNNNYCGQYESFDRDVIKWKESKSKKEEPQWEILEFKNLRSGIVYIKKDNGKFNSGNGLDWDLEKFDIKDHEIINSVKRFPDNTVWSVDMVTEHGIITAFKIVGSTMVAEIKNNIFPYDYPLYLSELKAPKEEQVPIKVHSLHHLGENSNDAATQIVTSHRIPPSKYQSIKSAIEDVLNGKTEYGLLVATGNIESFNKGYSMGQYDAKKYSESELLQARRDAFSSGYTRGWHNGCFEEDKTLSKKITDKKFEDYINSLK